MKLISALLADKPGLSRLLFAIVIGAFIAGGAWSSIKATLNEHTNDIVSLTNAVSIIPDLRESLARIEGALGIEK